MGKIWCIYFSPSGTTKVVMERIAAKMDGEKHTWDLLREPDVTPKTLQPEDVLLVGVPVFSGRIPTPCIPMLQSLNGAQTPAIAVAVYGNRDYDDALLELKNMLEEQAFLVIGAAAVVAQHSIFTKVAAGRPDAEDLEKLDLFSAECIERLQSGRMNWKELQVKGNKPYREISNVPMKPSADTTCTSCGLCARLCPVHAIDPANPRKTDQTRCISCTACIAACPQGARHFPKLMFVPASVAFEKKCAIRREPEWFL